VTSRTSQHLSGSDVQDIGQRQRQLRVPAGRGGVHDQQDGVGAAGADQRAQRRQVPGDDLTGRRGQRLAGQRDAGQRAEPQRVAVPVQAHSAGLYHWPKDDAVRQALTVLTSAETRASEATMVLFDEATLVVAQRIGEEFRVS
jgi:hypothetical protein